MMTPSLGLALLLLGAAIFVLALEIFIPSAGMLFVLAMVLVVSSIWVAYLVNTVLGSVFLFAVIGLAFVLPGIGLKIWRRSPIGRRMFLEAGDDPNYADDADGFDRPPGTGAGFDYQSLLGKTGKTVTPLRPSGISEFGGLRIDTVTEGMMLQPDVWVQVVDVFGNRVVVRRIDEPPPPISLENLDWNP